MRKRLNVPRLIKRRAAADEGCDKVKAPVGVCGAGKADAAMRRGIL